ncbi:MAG: hypothetical protein E6G77_20305 [Alphaproteobacteria bacterium]|nr:MAG: hypothetical protein E6G77_20305 [Alphaproteobacteria bacterium]
MRCGDGHNGEANSVRKKDSSAIIAADVTHFGHAINKDGDLGTHRPSRAFHIRRFGRGRVVSRFIASHNKVICGRTSKHLSAGSSTVGFVVALAANRIVWMITVLSLSLSGGVCMVRLRVHLLYNFALILALCMTVGIALLLLSDSQFCLMPHAAEIPPVFGYGGQLPLLW